MNQLGNVLAVIPARGGSKGLPGKNILPLLGKPVLAYTIEAAKQATTLDRVVLSTDSPEIAQIGRECGAEVPFLRPDHLATDTAHPTDVLKHALSFLKEQDGYQPDIVVTLQPTSPLRLPQHINEVVTKLQENSELDSVITVSEVELPPFWIFRPKDSLLRPFIDDGIDYSLKRRQEMEQLLRPNGAVYATRRWLLEDNGVIFSAFSGGNSGYILLDPVSALDMDTQIDFVVIEAMLKARI
jgi:CMP-N,N'-diacetyllegionaminic acid synthase